MNRAEHHFWGSAHDDDQDAFATVDGKRVEMDVSVNDDEEIGVFAWSEDHSVNVKIILTPAMATVLRDVLTTAVTEGVRLV